MFDTNNFDETTIDWKPLPGPDGEPADHILLSVLNIDETAKVVDVLFKFSANEKIVMHRHTANYTTFTIKGELRTYFTDGKLKDIRPAGVFKIGTPGEAHTEGGGDEDVIVYFSLRPYSSNAPIYEILDENLEVLQEMNFEDLKALNEEYSK
jgi:quercetin dioxygenase-like cupin family protein